MPPLAFEYAVPMLDKNLLDEGVNALLHCPDHDSHWFAVKTDELSLLCNATGLACLERALTINKAMDMMYT